MGGSLSPLCCVTCTFVRCGRESVGKEKVWEGGGVGGKVWEGGDIKPFTVLSVCTCIVMWGGRCEGRRDNEPYTGQSEE